MMTKTETDNPTKPRTPKKRYSDHLLPVYRRRRTIALFTVILIASAAMLLPPKGYTVPLLTFRLILFMVLCMAWSANILADKTKPLWMQAVAAFGLFGMIGWYFYAYVGINFDGLGHVFFNMKVMEGQWSLVGGGLLKTIQLAIASIFFGTIVGLLVAVLRVINNKTLNVVLIAFLEFSRAMPVLVVLMIVYFGLPFLNIRLSPFMSGTFVLSMINGAYISEIFRSGIASIHHTQVESAYSLGLTTTQTMRLVIVPQAFRIVVPPLTNRWVSMLKDTAIVSMVSVTELLKSAMIINTWKANPTPLIIVSMIYLAILLPLTIYTRSLEHKGHRTT